MDDSIRSLTTEALLEAILLHAGNLLVTSVGYCELAKEKLDSSHPAFSPLATALEAGEKARTVVRQVGDEWRRRKIAARAEP